MFFDDLSVQIRFEALLCKLREHGCVVSEGSVYMIEKGSRRLRLYRYRGRDGGAVPDVYEVESAGFFWSGWYANLVHSERLLEYMAETVERMDEQRIRRSTRTSTARGPSDNPGWEGV